MKTLACCIPIAFFMMAGTCNRSTGREVKKETRQHQSAQVILKAVSSNPAQDYVFSLRQNSLFTYEGKTAGGSPELYAGTFEWVKDTIRLAFYNNYKPSGLQSKAYVDTVSRQLVILGHEAENNRYMIIL